MPIKLQIKEKPTENPSMSMSLQIEKKVIEIIVEKTSISMVDIYRADRTEKDGGANYVWRKGILSNEKQDELCELAKEIAMFFHNAENSN